MESECDCSISIFPPDTMRPFGFPNAQRPGHSESTLGESSLVCVCVCIFSSQAWIESRVISPLPFPFLTRRGGECMEVPSPTLFHFLPCFDRNIFGVPNLARSSKLKRPGILNRRFPVRNAKRGKNTPSWQSQRRLNFTRPNPPGESAPLCGDEGGGRLGGPSQHGTKISEWRSLEGGFSRLQSGLMRCIRLTHRTIPSSI